MILDSPLFLPDGFILMSLVGQITLPFYIQIVFFKSLISLWQVGVLISVEEEEGAIGERGF